MSKESTDTNNQNDKEPVGLGQRIKNTAKHSAVFGLGGFMQQGASLILLPVYTRYLTVADYGILNMLLVAKPAISMLTSSMIGPSLFRSYYDYSDEESRSMVVSTTLFLALTLSLSMFALGHAFASQLSYLLTGSTDNSFLISLVLFTGALQSIQTVGMAVFRVKQQSARYTAISVSGLVVTLLITIYFVTVKKIGYSGVIYGALAGKIVVSFAILHIISPSLKFVFSFSEAKKIMKYGYPFVPLNILTLIEKSFVRIILQTISGPIAVGIFALATRFAQIIQTLVIAPMKLIRPAAVFDAEKDPRSSEFYSKLITYYLLLSTFVAAMIVTMSGDVIALIANPSYSDAYKVIPYSSLAVIFLGLQGYMSIGLMLKRKTFWFPLCTGLGLAVTLSLEVILTPSLGPSGVAISLAAGYALSSAMRYRISQKVYAIRFESRVYKLFIATAIVLIACISFPFKPSIISLIIKFITVIVGMPTLLTIFRFFEKKEIEHTKQIIRSKLKKAS